MKITGIAPWFGGKRTMAKTIVEELGPHGHYWEPFCGSMAVLMSKPRAGNETVNDLNGDLINLARVIRDPVEGPRFYRALRRTLPAQAIQAEAVVGYKEQAGQPADDNPDFQRAYNYFVMSWLGRNGVSGLEKPQIGFAKRFTATGGSAGTRWKNAVDSIPAWRKRMRTVSILHEDGIELLNRIQDAGNVAIYCDPPYLQKKGKYLHDFDDSTHRQLAESLQRFTRARVVVSYYNHPLLSEYYPGWTIRPVKVNKNLANQGGAGQAAEEVLIINGPSRVESHENQQQQANPVVQGPANPAVGIEQDRDGIRHFSRSAQKKWTDSELHLGRNQTPSYRRFSK